jgi:hypothetical protein
LNQKAKDGTLFAEVLKKKGVIPGIKVDKVQYYRYLKLSLSFLDLMNFPARELLSLTALTVKLLRLASMVLASAALSTTSRVHVSRNGNQISSTTHDQLLFA